MASIERNKELKDYFERKYNDVHARANGTILGYATGYYVVSAILSYWELHPNKKERPIKLKKLAKYAAHRPLKVRTSDGIRYYRLLKLAENSGILRIEARRKFWDGSIRVIVKLNAKAKLSDYEVEWPALPKGREFKDIKTVDSNNYDEIVESLFGEEKAVFWNDGWTEYDAEFIYKGIYAMLLNAASERKDKKRRKEIDKNYKKLYPWLHMIEEDCEMLLLRIKYLQSHNYGPLFY